MSNHSEKRRAAFDDRGVPFWEREMSPGRFERDQKSEPAEVLQSELSLADTVIGRPTGFDPYNAGDRVSGGNAAPRRKSLDDLRKLSEQIKRSRELKTPGK